MNTSERIKRIVIRRASINRASQALMEDFFNDGLTTEERQRIKDKLSNEAILSDPTTLPSAKRFLKKQGIVK